MPWKFYDTQHSPTSLDRIMADYPDAVAYDESGWPVDAEDFMRCPKALADLGYGPASNRRVLFWPNEESSHNDPGARAIAYAEYSAD